MIKNPLTFTAEYTASDFKNNDKLYEAYLQWLIGFIDAEGNFQIQVKKRKSPNFYCNYGYTFRLSLACRELEVLKEIKEFLGMGKIYVYEHRDEAHYAITTLDDLKKLVAIIDTYGLFTRHQAYRYAIFRWGLLNKINRGYSPEDEDIIFQSPINNIPPSNTKYPLMLYKDIVIKDPVDISVFSNWICGFISGEGSFCIDGNVFIVDVEQAEKEVLLFIRDFFGFNPAVNKKKLRENRKQTHNLRISSKADLLKLTAFLENPDPYFMGLRGFKKDQYSVWYKAFTAKYHP